MRKVLLLVAVVAGFGLAGSGAQAALISVDLSTQSMHVSSSEGDYDWPISSAGDGYVTPRGTYGVQRLEAMHYSRKYHNSPMPHSIFFHGGYAIHGTYSVAALGEPVSHGCIRISPENAAALYEIVRHEGARIAITGSPDASPDYAGAERRPVRATYASRRYGAQPLAYAPRAAPTFDEWVRSPFGAAQPRSYGQPSGYEPPDDDD